MEWRARTSVLFAMPFDCSIYASLCKSRPTVASALASPAPGASDATRLASTSSFILISLFTISSKITDSSSSGRSAPSLIPRLFFTKSARVMRFFTCGLCASVLSRMTEYEST